MAPPVDPEASQSTPIKKVAKIKLKAHTKIRDQLVFHMPSVLIVTSPTGMLAEAVPAGTKCFLFLTPPAELLAFPLVGLFKSVLWLCKREADAPDVEPPFLNLLLLLC